jgi:hypothetical protein
MTHTPSKTTRLGLSLCLLSLGACSAQASSSPPKDYGDDDTNGSTGGKGLGNVNGSSNAGTNANPGSGGAAPSGTAGSSNNPRSAGSSGGSTPSGTGGTTGVPDGALTSCPTPPLAGTAADLLIDDMEDVNNGIAKVGGRNGFWYTFSDAYGTMITPKPDPAGSIPLVPGSVDCHGASKGCIVVSGTVVANDEVAMKYAYAGVGFDFSNAKKPCHYNASAYSGIKFWARGDAELTLKVNIPATADAGGGGTCTVDCGNAHGLKVILTPTWTEYDLPFASIAPDPTWGPMPPPAFDKGNLLSVQVQFPPGGAFSAALDDFTFY